MAKVYDSILDLVGKTPLVELKRIEEKEAGRRDHRRGVQDAVHRDQERRERSRRFDQGNRRVDL